MVRLRLRNLKRRRRERVRTDAVEVAPCCRVGNRRDHDQENRDQDEDERDGDSLAELERQIKVLEEDRNIFNPELEDRQWRERLMIATEMPGGVSNAFARGVERVRRLERDISPKTKPVGGWLRELELELETMML